MRLAEGFRCSRIRPRWRCWCALAGAVGGGLAFTLLSFAVAGGAGVMAYAGRLLRSSTVGAETDGFLSQSAMVSWRTLLAALAPPLAPVLGLALTAALSI